MSFQPTIKYIRNFVNQLQKKPSLEREKIIQRLECSNLPDFFNQTASDWVLIHLSTEDFFMNSFTIESSELNKYCSEKVLDTNFQLSSTAVNYGYSFSDEGKKYFYEQNYEKGLDGSKMHPLFFYRIFEGYESPAYYEPLQEIVVTKEEKFIVILFERNELERYLLYRKHFLCRFLELKRAMPAADWNRTAPQYPKYKSSNNGNIWIRLCPEIAEDLNKSCDLILAAHIFIPTNTLDEIEEPKKKYADFIIEDWKNNLIIDEYSCDPDALDSYYEDRGRPFQTSPVYFDVLLKYKYEPERYELNECSINCKGAWSLQTYDINDEGQVHTYICYLSYLPYKEQLHWKQYNEKPKGPISKRAFNADFMAEWTAEYNPLQLIKQHIQKLSLLETKEGKKIWEHKDSLDSLFNNVHYVTSGKLNEYKDFLEALTILVIEGFQSPILTELAKSNLEYKSDMRILGCLKLIINGAGYIQEEDTIVTPLRDLQNKRSKFAAHKGPAPDFDLIEDCKKILTDVETAILSLLKIWEQTINNEKK